MEELFGWEIPLGEEIERLIRSWLLEPLRPLWSFIGDVLSNAYDVLVEVFTLPPWWLVIAVLAVLAGTTGSHLTGRFSRERIALGAAGGLLLLDLVVWALDFFEAGIPGRIRDAYSGPYSLLDPLRPAFLLAWVSPSLVMMLLLVSLAALARGWRLALVVAAGLLLIDLTGMWSSSMLTLSIMVVAVTIAAAVAVPIGILGARSRAASAVIKPVLDLMQTMPALVYVVLALVFFRLGVVPGIVATIVFSMPPAIRLTELGIRQVDPEVVEAGHAFGSTPGRILRQIQLPLAIPTIMAGINQVIMLALAMVVLAGLVGAPGLGRVVVEGISRGRLDLAIETGLAIVILAVFLDRVTSAVTTRSRAAQLERATQ